MKLGEGVTIEPLESGSAVQVSVVKAEDGYVWLRLSDLERQRVVQVSLPRRSAEALAGALREAAERD
jgi:hypothetical protein